MRVLSNHVELMETAPLDMFYDKGSYATCDLKHFLINWPSSKYSIYFMFYDKGSYATLGNFPSVEWILVNIMITTNCTENIL